jgi:hypothetical protein
MHVSSSSCRTPPFSNGRGLRTLPFALTHSFPSLAYLILFEPHQDSFGPLPSFAITTRFFQLIIVTSFVALCGFNKKIILFI